MSLIRRNILPPSIAEQPDDATRDISVSYPTSGGTTDQGSSETAADRAGIEAGFRAAQAAAGNVSESGAAGTIVAPAGGYTHSGSVITDSEFGTGVEPGRLVTRGGSDSGENGAGKVL